MKRALGDEYVLLIKHHPFVKQPPVVPEDCTDFAMDVTKLMDIEDLLFDDEEDFDDFDEDDMRYILKEAKIDWRRK